MTVFADSSALVKRYADEEHSDAVRELEILVVSALARVEVPAAIWKKCRMSQLSEPDAKVLIEAFESDYLGGRALFPVRVSEDILELATEVLAVHDLRAYDAVQLATAIRARDADPACSTFACFDGKLTTAASRAGFDELVESP